MVNPILPIDLQPAPMAELHPTIAGICRSFLNNATGIETKVAESPNEYLFRPLSDPEPDNASPEVIRYPVTVGRNVRQPENITIRDISYVITAIRQGFYEGYNLKKAVEVIRGMTDTEAQRSAKSTLPWFSGSVMHTKRANANVKQASFMIFDLDHVADIEATKALAVSKFPWIRYAFRSVTDGVKLIGMMNKPITDESKYRTIYSYLCLQIETLLKIPCDNTPDWARACFMSYDAELIDNLRNLKPLDAEDYYRQAVSFHQLGLGPSTSRHLDPSTSQLTDDYAKAEKVVAVLSKLHIDRQDWIKIGFALYSRFGERGKPLWDMFVDNPNYNDTQRKIDLHWNSFKNVRAITISSLFYLADKYGVNHE